MCICYDIYTHQSSKTQIEALSGDRAGQYSIRVNRQWRVCFTWDEGAYAVEITDYHQLNEMKDKKLR